MFYSIDSIGPVCKELRSTGQKIVLATGFFDLLHQEHIQFLTKAKLSGDVLIVAVESDARAHKLKGEGRPVEPQSVRCQHILDLAKKLGCGKNEIMVIKLGDDFDHFEAYESLMAAVSPDIYAVSSHTSHQDNKAFLTEKYGGQLLVVHDFNSEISTTQIINKQMV